MFAVPVGSLRLVEGIKALAGSKGTGSEAFADVRAEIRSEISLWASPRLCKKT